MKEMARERCRIGFVLEQALGHVTHAQNLRTWVDRDKDVEPQWMGIPYQAQDFWERLPGIPFSLKLSLRARHLVRETLSRQPLDCLYFHTQALTLCSLYMMKARPTVISLDATPEDFKSIASAYDAKPATGVIDRIKAGWFRKIFSRAAGLVACSDWVKESLVRDYGVPPNQVRVIRFAVDIDQWQPIIKNPALSRPLRLLFVGGDFARKGGHVLLSAFREGLSEICELDIVTKDEAIAAERSVRIHSSLSPNTPLLKQLFAQADLFVLPTQGDATPMAVLEAMACALPVITTNVGALGEMVQDGITGYLVPCDDAKAIIDKVGSLARRRETLAEMGTAGRLAVEREFNAETNYKRLIAYLKEVSDSNPAIATGDQGHG